MSLSTRRWLTVVLLAVGGLFVDCKCHSDARGAGVPPLALPTAASSVGGPKEATGSYAGASASIHGVAHFSGALPPPKEVTIPPGCAPDNAGPVFSNAVLVKADRLQNVFVWIKSGVASATGSPPADEIVVDQHGCMYAPRVTGAQVGQRVTFLNSDPVFHNVRTVTTQNEIFNETMPTKEMRITKTFDKPEVMVNAKCDVHPWMSGYIGVVAHPYFAVTNEAGEYSFRNVPAGEVVVEAWHEVFGRKTQKIVLAAHAAAEADFTFQPQ